MSHMTCPQCGAPLNIDVLTREPRPCAQCGTEYSLDSEMRPKPDAELQQTINRQKYFEIAAVVIMILVGFGYLAISTNKSQTAASNQASPTDLASMLTTQGFQEAIPSTILGQEFQTYTQQNEILQTTVDLISFGEESQSAIGTILIAVSLPKDRPLPPDEIIEPAIQKTFNAVTELGEGLVPHSTHGLEKAISTTVPISNTPIQHHKGVAQTSSGWKITYINYREVQESEYETPFLLFIYQKLSIASNPHYESFHKTLYTAINSGQNIKRTMQQQENEDQP